MAGSEEEDEGEGVGSRGRQVRLLRRVSGRSSPTVVLTLRFRQDKSSLEFLPVISSFLWSESLRFVLCKDSGNPRTELCHQHGIRRSLIGRKHELEDESF
ncbi:hypothetical protein CRG98_016292 [Punica granatum]|uniref:Uncharacterized protein n=1 Tax=Punica granatum TaxID=22663 RepID=A0A2I0K422_PUNGR|nr:hypothetical protein CRG98_016292 [Punica granatum]